MLTNIVEEESSFEEEPRTFEQDEQYLNECLKVLNNSSEDVVSVRARTLGEEG